VDLRRNTQDIGISTGLCTRYGAFFLTAIRKKGENTRVGNTEQTTKKTTAAVSPSRGDTEVVETPFFGLGKPKVSRVGSCHEHNGPDVDKK
jgi:hypothetical protein